MGATCSACGDCCDPVWFPLGAADVRQGAVTARTDPHAANLTFAAAHWRATGAVDADGRHAYTCDAFDAQTRLCTAHEARPPVCRGYPWYGKPPTRVEPALPDRCSHHADLVDLPFPSRR
ncbi:MAG TPA: YkgJ family cysteine cluster protein [Mycobacteriales bacterium]|nr:YkgJ family cysteine cluster protein [Mycobacteriales bacterium]